MNVICVWKVAAQNTQSFIQEMRKKNLRQDGYATLVNQLSGFNFWYETDESFGDVTEFAANRISESHSVNIRNFSINAL